MRLGIDGRELRPDVRTGIRRYVVEVVRAAVERGWSVTLYGDRRTSVDGLAREVTFRQFQTASTVWWDQVALPAALRRDGITVFLSPYYKAPLAAPCPVVLTIHDLFFIGYPGRPRPFYDAFATRAARLYARAANLIVTDSEYSRRAALERLRVAPGKVRVIPLTVGCEFRPARLTPGARARYGLAAPYILYVGNFKPHKNLPRLIRAYARLPERLRATYRLVLAGGDGAARHELETLADRAGVAGHVVFPGRIDDADLPAVYSECAVFVLTSLEEGFGLPAIEAMACGAPVIAANRGALPEVVADAGVLVEADREDAISAAVARVLSADDEREAMRARGLVRSREFSSERTAGRLLTLLRETCDVASAGELR